MDHAMKFHLAVIVAVGLTALGETAFAKVTAAVQNDNERIVNTVAGPAPSKEVNKSAAQSRKKTITKTRIKPKPPLNDPN